MINCRWGKKKKKGLTSSLTAAAATTRPLISPGINQDMRRSTGGITSCYVVLPRLTAAHAHLIVCPAAWHEECGPTAYQAIKNTYSTNPALGSPGCTRDRQG